MEQTEKWNIIDLHTHIYPTVLARRALEVVGRENDAADQIPVKENLWRFMKEEGIALSVVQPVVSKPSTQTDVNRFAREIVRPNVLAFGGLHPDCEHVQEEIEKLKDMNMAGIKFHPPFQQVYLTDDKYTEMWKKINHLGFPVLIHCGKAKVKQPFDLYPSGVRTFLKYLSDIPVILAHMGGRSEDPEEEKILMEFPENVYVDTAMSAERGTPEEFERLTSLLRPERVIFGSDFPYGTQKAAAALIKNSSFSDNEKAMMLGGTAAKILGDKIRTR